MAAKKKTSPAKPKSKKKAAAPPKVRAGARPKAKAKAPAKAKAKAPAKPRAKAPAKPKAKAKAQARPKARPKAPARPKAKAKAAPPRRDGGGHLEKKYAAHLLARSRESRDDANDTRAFLRKSASRSRDPLAEELGEEAVAAMTSGEDQGERLLDLEVEEERGGPFVSSSGAREFAHGTDKSNPRRSTREPFPRT